jgi:colicin import membrane protein
VTAASTTENVEPRTDSYAARIRALIRSNIVHASDIEGNPVAEVLVTLAPDGLVLEVSLTKSSGVRSWDDAVVRAIHRTQRVPPDPTGKVPSQLVVTFRPR